jgi:hypothetical protein
MKVSRFLFIGFSLILVLSFMVVALPQKAQAADDETAMPANGKFSSRIANGVLYVYTSQFNKALPYRVRVKDAAKSQPKFFNLVKFVTLKNKDQLTTRLSLPQALRHVLWIDVCLKNQLNDKVVCRKVFNPNQ